MDENNVKEINNVMEYEYNLQKKLVEALKDYKYEELPSGNEYVMYFDKWSEPHVSWKLVICTIVDNEKSALALLFEIHNIVVAETDIKDKIIDFLNTVNSNIFMGKFYIHSNSKVYFRISVDITGSQISSNTIKKWIKLGNSAIREYYIRLKNISDGK